MRKLRSAFVVFLVIAFMALACLTYVKALNFKIKVYHTSTPEAVQDEERKPSVWDDPEWWKNPWVL